jgi:hypothetical protein
MKLTNKFNLPDTFVNVIERPTYSKGKADISATELINSPKIVTLKKKHWDDLEQDASEMVWALFGSAVHNILEHGRGENHVVEERIHTMIEGWHLSGAIDLQEVYDDGIVIKDYKVTGAWAVMNEKQDWHNQLNIYAWMVRTVKQKPIKGLQIVAIVRDWSAREASNRENYPQSPVAMIDIPLWTDEEQDAYIKERVGLHAEAYFEMNTEGALPDCTPDEMWEKPTTYAIKKPGAARAKSVHKTLDEAQHALNQVSGYLLEIRQGERTRCASYCQVSKFCNQYKNYLKEQQ